MLDCDLAEKLTRFRNRLRHLAGVFACALCALGAAAAFAAYDWRDLLNQLVRLKSSR